MDDASRAEIKQAEVLIGRHERGLSIVLAVFMSLGIAGGAILLIAAMSGDERFLLSGLVAIGIGILSALGRVLIEMSRDLKRLYYLD